MMKRFGILLLVLTLWSLGTGCFAQIVVMKEPNFVSPSPVMITVDVVDSLTRQRLRDVAISIASKKDTVYAYTDQFGSAYFNNYYRKDSVEFKASLVGYKSLALKTKIEHLDVRVKITMAEDPEEINTIVVKGRSVMMISRGDTTVYNTADVLTMEGDNLAELLKRLPGIQIRDGQVMAQGRKVNKILVNGNMLFGNNISDALRLIKSDMVKEVKVYEQHDQARLIQADTLKPKDHVVDVITKGEFKGVQEFLLRGALGIYTEKNHEDKIEHIENIGLNFSSYAEDKPRIRVYADLNNNMNMNHVTTSPTMGAVADCFISRHKKFKSSFHSALKLNGTREEDYSSMEDIYTGMDRVVLKSDEKDIGKIDLRYNGGYKFQRKDRHEYNLGAEIAFQYDRSLYDTGTEIKEAGNTILTYAQQASRDKSFSSNLTFAYKNINTKSRNLEISFKLPYSLGRMAESYADTLTTSSYPQFMTGDDDSYFVNPNLNIDYRKNFKSGFGIWVNTIAQMRLEENKRLSWDQLLQVQNELDSYSYTQKYIEGRINIKASYSKNGFGISAGLAPRLISQIVNEHYGYIGNSSKLFFMPAPSFQFSWRKGGSNISIGYNEEGVCPSVEQLRSSLDNNNPLYLRTGNPNLRLSIRRNANLQFRLNSSRTGSFWSFDINYINQSNMIGNNTTYFMEDTYLEEFGYTAVAGSQLTRPENIGNGSSLTARLQSSFFINALKSNFIVAVSGDFSENPFLVAGERSLTQIAKVRAGFNYLSAFSKIFSLNLAVNYSYGRNMMNSQKIYNSSGVFANISPSVIFAKNYKFSTDYGIDGEFTDREGAGYLYDTLNCSLEGTFGKKKQYIVSIHANDILNSTKSRSYSLDELYMRSMSRSVLGRNVLLQFVIKFK